MNYHAPIHNCKRHADLSPCVRMLFCYYDSSAASVSESVLNSPVVSLVVPRLVYGISTHRTFMISVGTQCCRQTDTLIFSVYTSRSVTSVLSYLHWLRSPERIDFKLAMLVTTGALWPVVAVSVRLHTARRSPLPIRSPVVVILVASDLTYRTRLSTVRERAFPSSQL